MVPYIMPFVPGMHKGEFCYCTGIVYSQLRKYLKESEGDLKKLGYNKYSKYLSPRQVKYLIDTFGLSIDANAFASIVKTNREFYMPS